MLCQQPPLSVVPWSPSSCPACRVLLFRLPSFYSSLWVTCSIFYVPLSLTFVSLVCIYPYVYLLFFFLIPFIFCPCSLTFYYRLSAISLSNHCASSSSLSLSLYFFLLFSSGMGEGLSLLLHSFSGSHILVVSFHLPSADGTKLAM